MLSRAAVSVVFCSIALAQEPALQDAASSAELQSGVRAGFWWADYDRDGLDDAFVVGADGSARLLRNSGDGSFADVTTLSGLDGLGAARFAAWNDYDRDGAPDVFVGTQSGPGHLMRNAGDGTFQDVTQFVGLTHSGRHLAAQWFDYDLDGLVDLAVRTDTGEHLYHALPKGHFEAVDLGSVKPRPSIDVSADAMDIDSVLEPDGSAPVTPDKDGNQPAACRPSGRLSRGVAGVPGSPTRRLTTPPLPPPGSYLISACPPRITDTATGSCLQASSVPTLGMLYPLTINLNVSGAGNVGIGTITPIFKLDVAGTARITDTLTLNPGVDQALDVSTGSIYKGGALFIHTKGGISNTSLGLFALKNVTTGSSNSANGYLALYSNTTGNRNTASGSDALKSNTTGLRNTAGGSLALTSNTTGDNNTASGSSALTSNTSGYLNTASGYAALKANTTGHKNTATGALALNLNTTGVLNTASGYLALQTNTTGTGNTADGAFALASNTNSNSSTAVGFKALFANSFGARNTATGYEALLSNTLGNENVANGFRALRANTTGYDNTAGGARALYSNTLGSRNTASGHTALSTNVSGSFNTAEGADALFANTSGNYNTASGDRALKSNTVGNSNTADGQQALYLNTSGFRNTAIGYRALYANSSGTRNTAIGDRVLFANTTGYKNTASGQQALSANTVGAKNFAGGYKALLANTTGNNNIALGSYAGSNLTVGSNNITIGHLGVAAEAATTRVGTVGAQTRAFIAGIRGVTTGSANAIPVLIDSNGQLGTVSSSRRFKRDIRDMGDATARLLELRPVTFHYKQEQSLPDGSKVPSEYGLIAEEVAEVFPDLVVYGDDGRPFTVKYHILASMLLNEMKKEKAAHERDLDEVRRKLAEQADELTRLRVLEARLTALESRVSPAPTPAATSTGDR